MTPEIQSQKSRALCERAPVIPVLVVPDAARAEGLPVVLVDERSSSVEAAQRFARDRAEGRKRRRDAEALDAVAEASTAHGEGFSYDIRGDLVHVEKKAQGAQRRHLAKKATKPRKPRA